MPEIAPYPAIPRPPTNTELDEIREVLAAKWGECSLDALLCSYIAVYDSYCTSSPGFVGKLVSIVFDGDPGYVATLGKPIRGSGWMLFLDHIE